LPPSITHLSTHFSAVFISLAVTIVSALALFAMASWVGAQGRSLRSHERTVEPGDMRRYLVWGLVYSNPQDPRGWVPKPRGAGLTVNARTRGAARALVLLTLSTLAGGIATELAVAFYVIRSGVIVQH
jgi:uncharacterized membrane protein